MSKSTRINQRASRISARPLQITTLPLRRTWPISLCIGLVVGSIVVSGDALAGGPTGGTVVGGAGTITQSGNNTVINQASRRLALNWQTFNVGANESVLFNQPSRSAVALNRILDQNPSQIFGRINSNGQVFLINTHGIIFGASAQLNVGGLMASTLDLTPSDFLAGHYNLNASGAAASVVNHGLIQAASGGSVSLVGGSVLNDGLIFANYGKINLDGADHATLDFDGNGLINIQITGDLKQRLDNREAAVTNKGTLKADDGTVVLQASAAKDLFTNLVNNSGVIDASGINTDGGVVRLVGNGGNVESSGSINVSGMHGGSAQLLSDQNVSVSGSVDASGTQGGGSIRVGGGQRGREGLLTAANSTLGAGATLDADATQSGNGGSVVVWGNESSTIAGNLSARGGALGGNGGAIETSAAHVHIADSARVNTLARYGQSGNWLIDPKDFTIAASGGDITGATLGSNLGGGSVTILSSDGGTNGSGDINVNDTVSWSANTLTLTAANNVNINSALTGTGTSALALNSATANGDPAVPGGVININKNISTGGSQSYNGPVILGANATLASSGNGAIDFTSTLDGSRNLTVNTGGVTTFAGAVGATNALTSLTTNAAGTTTLSGNVSTTGAQTYNDAVTLGGTDTLTGTAVSLAGGVTGATHGLTITGNTTLGTATGLSALSVSGTSLLNGSVTTTGTQTYSGAVTLGGNDTLTGSAIDFGSTLDGAFSLTVDATGAATFGGAVGSSSALKNLTVSSGTFSANDLTIGSGGLSVTTTAGDITQPSGIFTVSGTSTFSAVGHAITLTNVNAFGGTVNLTGGTTQITNGGNLTLGTLNTDALTAISNSGALNLGGGSVSGDLSATASTSITLNGVLTGLGNVAFSGATPIGSGSAAGTGSITGIGTQTFNLTGMNAGTSGGITFTGFTVADAKNITGAAGFDDTSKVSDGVAFNLATNVAGTGTITNVAGNFADNTGTSAASGIAYSGFGFVSGSGTAVTGVTGSFNLGTEVSSASGINYSGFSLSTVAGSGAGATITGTGQTYNLTGNNAGNNSTLSWTSFGNLNDATGTINFGTVGSVSGNVTAHTLNYGTYGTPVTFDLSNGNNATTAIGGTWNGVTTVAGSANNDTITGSGKTYTLDNAVADKGSSGTLSWSSFENINDATGTVNFGTAGTVSGNITAQTLDYSSYLQALMLNVTTGAITGGGVGGVLSGYSTVKGNAAQSNTVAGTGQTYALDNAIANKGSSNGYSWSAFQNINDGTGTINFGTAGSVSGNIAAHTLNYGSHTAPVTFALSNGSGATTGIGGTWSGVTTVTGSGGSDTITGTGQTYNLTGANAGNNGTVSWSSFENLSDGSAGNFVFANGAGVSGTLSGGGAGTLDYSAYTTAVNVGLGGTATGTGGWSGIATAKGGSASDTISGSGKTYNLSGSNAGSSGALSWSSFENLSDGTGTVNFGSVGSVSGNIAAKALSYGSYIGPVTFALSNGSGATTGIGGTWSGVATVSGNGSGTISGNNQTYNLTSANAGNNGAVSWTSFGNIADTGTGTIATTGAQTYSLSGNNAGTVTTLLPGGYTGIGNINAAGSTINFGTGGSVTGNITAQTLNYASYGTAVTFNLSGGPSTGVGGSWSGVTTVAGSANNDTITGSGKTYTLDNAVADKGSSGTLSWSSFENINDATGTVNFGTAGTVSGNITAQTLDYSSYLQALMLNVTTGAITGGGVGGVLSGYSTVKGNAAQSNTVAGTGQTYALDNAIANKGSSNGYSWSAFQNINDGTGTINFGTAGSVSGNIAAHTLNYGSHTAPVTFALSNGSGATTGIGGTWSGVTTVTGSGGSDTITGTGQTYNLTGANAGNNGTVSWSSFENLSDGSAGNFVFANGAGVSGTLSGGGAGTLDYSAYTTAVNVGLGGTATGTGGWSGIATAKGGSASDTISGSGKTYNLSGSNAGSSGALSWSSFENLSDGTGTVNFGSGGSVSGNITARTLSYGSYGTPVTFALANGSGATTGIGGTWSGVTTVAGSGGSDTISGTNQTYNLTSANAGNNGTVSWTSFENIADAGTGTLSASNQTWSLTGHNQGAVTNLAGAFSGIGNLIDTGTGHFNMHSGADGDISGNLNGGTAGSVDYSGYTTSVNVNLSGTGTTGVGGTTSGISAVTASSNLGVSGNASGALTITTTGAGTTMTLGATTIGGNLNITATGPVLQTGGALAVVGTSTIDAGANAITLAGGNNNFGGTVNLTGGATQIHDINALSLGTVNTAALTVNSGDLTLGGAVHGTAVSLTSSGAISEGASGSLTATTLNGQSTGATSLNGANHIGTLGSFSAAGFGLTNAQTLAVTGPVNGGASTTLTTTAGDLAINGAVSGTTTTLKSAGAISEGASGSLTATTLNGQSTGATSLNGANHIGTLGSFTAAGFGLTNAQALAVSGPINGGSSAALTTTAGNLAINGAVTGTTTTLKSAGAITEGASGSLTATTLNGQSTGATTLNGTNHIGTLGSFSAANFSLTNAQSLAVTGPVNGGASTALTTTAGGLAINGAVTGTTTTLKSAGAISEGASGSITASNLSGQSSGATSLNGANHIGTLGSFSAAGFGLTNAQTLAVAGPINGGASTALTTTAGDLAINGAVSGTTTTLTSAGAINEGAGGSLTATTLNGQSTGATSLNGTNHIGTLGSFSAAGFGLTNAQSLAVTGPVNGGASTALTTTTGDVAINGAVSGTTTTLTSAGAISEGTSGNITASNLSGHSSGATSLNGANHIGTLGGFSAAGFGLTNAQTLAVSGPINGGSSAALTTTTGDLAINGAVSGTTTTLKSAGATTEGASGSLTATTLNGQSTGATTLNGTNHIGTLGSFSAAGFSLTNAQSLAVTGPVNGGASTALTTSTGDLAINGAVTGTTTTLKSAGAITEGPSGVITASTLTGQSVGSTDLNGANRVDTLGSFTADFSLTNAQTLTVAGQLDGGPVVTLTTTAGDLIINGAVNGTTTTLNSAGAISEGASGSLTATTLNGQSTGATSLNGANHIGTLGSFTAAGFGLTNAQALAVSGPINGGSSAALTTTAGNLAINGAVTGTTTTLKSAGAITEGASGSLTATTLNGQSTGATTLNGTNHIGTLGSFSAANFSLTNAQSLAVTGPVNGGASTALTTTAGGLAINGAVTGTTTTLKSAGAISEGASGSITASNLSGQSSGATSLNGANHIGTLGSFSAAGFGLTNAQTLAVAGPINGGASTALTTTAGDLAINGAVSGTTTTLTSAGAINEGAGGSLTATTLNGQSTGATSLNGTNHIGTLGSFSAAGFGLTNAQSLAVTGPVNGGASTTLTTTAGDLAINGAVSGNTTTLMSAGAISEGASGVITAGTLSGQAVGKTVLGSAVQRNNNLVDVLGNFSSTSGFSMTNNKTLTLASVAGSLFTVNAGTSAFYLSVTNGDLLQRGTTPVYDGLGIWGSTGRLSTGSAPIYVVGTGVQTIANEGISPAYFYAIDSGGSLLPLGGGFAVNVPTASGAGDAQNAHHGDSYIDPSVITANYRSYGIVPSGVRLPADQQSGCDPDQPDQADCQDDNSVGMVGIMLNARR